MKNKSKKLKVKMRAIANKDRELVRKFIKEHWSSKKVVAHGKIFYPHNLPGFVAYEKNRLLGLITYDIKIKRKNLEIITIDAVIKGVGIGTGLLKAVEKVARKLKLRKIWLITTNDNIDALAFYQKRGFKIVAVHRNALELSRKLKPEIPLIGNFGIPMRDEIEFEKILK